MMMMSKFKYQKYTIGRFALLLVCLISFQADAQWWDRGGNSKTFVADPATCDLINQGNQKYQKFLCKGSELERETHQEVDGLMGAECPETKNYGHYVVMIDSTEGYQPSQYTKLINQVVDENVMEYVGPYDKVSIINVDGKNSAGKTDYIFSSCKPRSGMTGSMYPINSFIGRSDAKATLETKYLDFLLMMQEATAPLGNLGEKGGYSQLMEQLKELSLRQDLDFQVDWSYRKIIIFSDLVQNSVNLSIQNNCAPVKWDTVDGKKQKVPTGNGKCPTYDEVKSKMNEVMWQTSLPDFGVNPPEVFIYYLNCRHDPKLNSGMLNIWESYFKELGMKLTWDINPDCDTYNKNQ